MEIKSNHYSFSYPKRLTETDGIPPIPQDTWTVQERLGLPDDATIKVQGLSQEEIDRMKFLGPSHRDGINWDEIESSLMNTETKSILQIGKEMEGRVVFDPRVMDAGFMDRFLVMNQSYRDNIERVFKGEEKARNLEKLDGLFKKTAEELRGRFTEVFAAFFGEEFDKEKFDSHLEQTMQEKQQQLHQLTKQNQDAWYQYRTFSFGKTDFAGLLAEQPVKGGSSSSIETMSYEEMSILSIGIQEINKDIRNGMIHTPLASPEDIASYLGQAQLKGNMLLKHKAISEPIREKFAETLTNHINTELQAIIEMRKKKFAEMGIPDRQLVQPGQAQAAIANVGALADLEPAQFRAAYMASIEGLGPYNDPFNRQFLVHDWNGFIGRLALSRPEPYILPTGEGSLLDELV